MLCMGVSSNSCKAVKEAPGIQPIHLLPLQHGILQAKQDLGIEVSALVSAEHSASAHCRISAPLRLQVSGWGRDT